MKNKPGTHHEVDPWLMSETVDDGESVAELSGFMFRQKLTPAPFDPAKFGAFP
ncbi:MAG: hypothetical protein WD181_05145 [Solirubrobacterales bacterium]